MSKKTCQECGGQGTLFAEGYGEKVCPVCGGHGHEVEEVVEVGKKSEVFERADKRVA